MGSGFLNLYRITLREEGNTFTRFEPLIPLDKELLNKVRYRLFKRYNLPAIYRNGKFYVLGDIEDESVNIKLSDGSVVLLRNGGKEELKGFVSEEEVQNFIKDFVEAHNVRKLFAKEYIERYKTVLKGKLGDIYTLPYLINRVYRKGDNYLLHIDFRFRLILKHNLQTLLEEGKLSISELENLRLKPLNYDFVSRVKEVIKAEKLGRSFIKTLIQGVTGRITRKYWRKILYDKEEYEKTYVVFLENNYVYPASMLHPVIDFESVEGEISRELSKKIRLSPKERIGLIRNALKKYRAVLSPWGVNVSTREEEVEGKVHYNNILVDAEGRTTRIETNIRHFLKHLKPFVRNPQISTFLLIVDRGKDKQLSYNREQFLEELGEFLKNKGISLNVEVRRRIVAQKRIEALKELSFLLKDMRDCDFVLVFLEEYGRTDPYTEDILLYDYLKKRLLEEMIPSQVVLNTTLKKKPSYGWEFIVLNVAEQIMAKTGNIPYKIKGGIEGADYFIGIDISRITRGNTVNVGSFTKIFGRDGTFLRYKLLSENAFGESVSKKAIQELFLTLKEMGVKEGARIVIHRDGRFQGNEVENFINLSGEFGYEVELLEVIKRGNPRIFSKESRMIKGSFYKLNENTLILATYNNIYRGTHQPLKLRKVYGKLSVEELASQVLSLTLMNYSSFQPIKLPATTHYADKITKLLLRGIEPAQKEGDIMYWL